MMDEKDVFTAALRFGTPSSVEDWIKLAMWCVYVCVLCGMCMYVGYVVCECTCAMWHVCVCVLCRMCIYVCACMGRVGSVVCVCMHACMYVCMCVCGVFSFSFRVSGIQSCLSGMYTHMYVSAYAYCC